MILDTNAMSAWAEGNPSVKRPLESARSLVVPSIVLGEYYFGIRQSKFRKRYEEWLRSYLPHTKIAQVGSSTADHCATIRSELKEKGTPIPSNDNWIAAITRQHQLPILSNDHHFDSFDGLERIPF